MKEYKTTEFVYIWPNGREEVRYRRPYNSEDAKNLTRQLKELAAKHGEQCPYKFRHV